MYNLKFSGFKSLSWTSVVPWLIALIVLWTIVNTSFKKDYKTGIIESDGKGYYAYLPAVFIYHDLNYRFYYKIERETYYNPNLYFHYLRAHNNSTVNKYYVGTAICLMPFFLIGHTITQFTELPADGYSYYYTLMVHLGALFYLLLALFGLRKLLRTFTIDEKTIAWVLIAIVFGTNLFYYVVTEFAMSHVYSFTAITWFSFTIRKYFLSMEHKYLLYSALLLGIITLIRPINILIVLSLPFLADSPGQLISGLKNILTKSWVSILAAISFLFIIAIQLIIYKLSTGQFLIYSYKEEGFNFMNPQIWNFLFSYKKGMFVYTPLLLLSLVGYIYMFRDNRYRFYSLLGFLFTLIYVFSSWHMWYYGGSFSQRVMVEFYAFFSVLLATALQQLKSVNTKRVFLGLIVLLIVFCQIQTYQYRRMQIHWSDMNKEKYWEVFLRIDKL
jgi:hypothetical protein